MQLTPRERETAALASEGLSYYQMAGQLLVTVNTVKTHMKHIYKKCSVTNRVQLERWLADERGPLPGSL